MNRRGYLDWLRGIAVLIMIEAHTLDAWTRLGDRRNAWYAWAMSIGGFGAPVFLFLAGIALPLAAGSRMRNGRSAAEAAALALRRGWQIFGLAFLFRLQSWLISGGSWRLSLLKVDILNVMGLSLVIGAWLWGLGKTKASRALLLGAAAVAATMLTPLVRATPLLTPLPDPIEWYFRPDPGRGTFTLFPWAGFLLAGAAVGLWLEAARTTLEETRVNLWLLVIGVAVAGGGYAASWLPPLYANASFWTSSPTFFFLRFGILIVAVPVAYGWGRAWKGYSPLEDFGRASLFVYWIHVEIVYGVLTGPVHKQLPFSRAVMAFGGLSLLLFALAKAVSTTTFAKFRKELNDTFSHRILGHPRGLGGS